MNSVMFGIYGNALHYLQSGYSNTPSMLNVSVAGGLGGFGHAMLATPTEMIRIRMQMQGIGERGKRYFSIHQTSKATRMYENSLDCVVKLYKQGGLRALYQGVPAALYRDVLGCSAYFIVWEKIICYFTPEGQTRHEVSIAVQMIGGGITGTISWAILYPFDILKTRLQVDGFGLRREYRGLWHCLIKSCQTEGVQFLFKGMAPTVIRAFPSNAATLSVYSLMTSYFHRKRFSD